MATQEWIQVRGPAGVLRECAFFAVSALSAQEGLFCHGTRLFLQSGAPAVPGSSAIVRHASPQSGPPPAPARTPRSPPPTASPLIGCVSDLRRWPRSAWAPSGTQSFAAWPSGTQDHALRDLVTL